MKKIKLFLLLIAPLLFVGCNNDDSDGGGSTKQPQGIYLNKYAFGIPLKDVDGIGNESKFSISFWVNVKEFNHGEWGTTLLSVRDVYAGFNDSDYGWIWSSIGPSRFHKTDEGITMVIDNSYSNPSRAEPFTSYDFKESKWYYITYVFDYNNGNREPKVYINGELVYEQNAGVQYYTDSFNEKMVLMIGGFSFNKAPLDAYIDNMQIYGKVLSASEVKESMRQPISSASLLAYWDFEDGSLVDSEGFLPANGGSGSLKAIMYEIETCKTEDEERGKVYENSIGLIPRSFTFAKGK